VQHHFRQANTGRQPHAAKSSASARQGSSPLRTWRGPARQLQWRDWVRQPHDAGAVGAEARIGGEIATPSAGRQGRRVPDLFRLYQRQIDRSGDSRNCVAEIPMRTRLNRSHRDRCKRLRTASHILGAFIHFPSDGLIVHPFCVPNYKQTIDCAVARRQVAALTVPIEIRSFDCGNMRIAEICRSAPRFFLQIRNFPHAAGMAHRHAVSRNKELALLKKSYEPSSRTS
jgi:hypothetical protein